MSFKKNCVTRAVYVFLCKVRLLLPLQIDHVMLGFLLLIIARSCLLLRLDTVLTCFLGRPPVLGYLLPFISQGGRWDVSLQKDPGEHEAGQAWRNKAGMRLAGAVQWDSWEGAGGRSGHSLVLLACHSGWKQHLFLEGLWGD